MAPLRDSRSDFSWAVRYRPGTRLFAECSLFGNQRIDRAVYVEVTVPAKQAFQPLPLLGAAVAKKLKPICAVPEDNSAPREDQLCVNRK